MKRRRLPVRSCAGIEEIPHAFALPLDLTEAETQDGKEFQFVPCAAVFAAKAIVCLCYNSDFDHRGHAGRRCSAGGDRGDVGV